MWQAPTSRRYEIRLHALSANVATNIVISSRPGRRKDLFDKPRFLVVDGDVEGKLVTRASWGRHTLHLAGEGLDSTEATVVKWQLQKQKDEATEKVKTVARWIKAKTSETTSFVGKTLSATVDGITYAAPADWWQPAGP